nr:4-aminobutyrate aminotransferase, mitochondrial-like [Leptinotarsa decemlineata]
MNITIFFSLHRPQQPYRVYNTWLGDPGKLYLLESFLNVLNRENLLDQVNKSGARLKNGLHSLENEFPSLINSVRGRGTFLAFNATSVGLRDQIVAALKKKGILSGGCGNQSVRLRPALTFQEQHADIFLDRLRQVLKEVK